MGTVITVGFLAIIMVYAIYMVIVEGVKKPKYVGKINWLALSAYALAVVACCTAIVMTLTE